MATRGKSDESDKTISGESVVGRRLVGVRRKGTMYIVFQGRSIPIARRITIGRDSDNAIVLDDMLASRRHAVIQKVKDEYFIEDQGSTNGTCLNGTRIPSGRYVKLDPTDTILIGRTELSLMHLR